MFQPDVARIDLLRSRFVLVGLVAVVVVGVGVLSGCDRQAAQVARMQKVLDEAVGIIETAEIGYVPNSEKTYVAAVEQTPVHEQVQLGDYRQKVLSEAVSNLQTVASGGSPAQQSVANQMLARVDASAARHLKREADAASAMLLSTQGAQIFELMKVVENRQAAALVLEQNDVVLLEKLDNKIKEVGDDRDTLAQQVDALTTRRDALLAQETGQREVSTDFVGQAQAFADQAFVAEGDEKFALRDQESESRRKASLASIAADGYQQEADLVTVELTLLEKQLEVTEQTLASLKNKRTGAAKRLEETRTQQRLFQKDRDVAFAQVEETYQGLAAAYNEQVVQLFDRSLDRIGTAQKHIRDAKKGVPSRSRNSVMVDVLAVQADHADVSLRYAASINTYYELTQMVLRGLERSEISPEDTPMVEALPKLKEQRQALVDAATAGIEDARTIAGSVNVDAANQLNALLDEYQQQLSSR